ncbi:hypothetical protein SAMN05421788_112197 [Filimonas lacunae]|uniref:Uncharacterized protein n=1 Tax=Filimonas lacunae TaxID=477680 RepID=A0A173MLP7_9BACT|nr:hypothetical protein [Filimonas lacunae]BAV08390.1 hypothetical protein FLA_4426 [Filimonas lacunae]SIT33487.1 hypothetical protein SAMN05421788_112197 [Filimonas lacunae]
MPNEILLVQYNNNTSTQNLELEARRINDITAFASSFFMFRNAYEIFDMRKHKKITSRKRSFDLYQAAELPAFHFIMGMN